MMSSIVQLNRITRETPKSKTVKCRAYINGSAQHTHTQMLGTAWIVTSSKVPMQNMAVSSDENSIRAHKYPVYSFWLRLYCYICTFEAFITKSYSTQQPSKKPKMYSTIPWCMFLAFEIAMTLHLFSVCLVARLLHIFLSLFFFCFPFGCCELLSQRAQPSKYIFFLHDSHYNAPNFFLSLWYQTCSPFIVCIAPSKSNPIVIWINRNTF